MIRDRFVWIGLMVFLILGSVELGDISVVEADTMSMEKEGKEKVREVSAEEIFSSDTVSSVSFEGDESGNTDSDSISSDSLYKEEHTGRDEIFDKKGKRRELKDSADNILDSSLSETGSSNQKEDSLNVSTEFSDSISRFDTLKRGADKERQVSDESKKSLSDIRDTLKGRSLSETFQMNNKRYESYKGDSTVEGKADEAIDNIRNSVNKGPDSAGSDIGYSFMNLSADYDGTADTDSITIEKARDILIRRNNDIKSVWLEWEAKQREFKSTFGMYEPRFTGEINRREQGKLDTDFTELTNTYYGGIKGKMPTGTEYEVKYQHTGYIRTRDKESSVFFGCSLTQPIFKDLLFQAPILNVKIAKMERETAFNRFRSLLVKKLYELESYYWKTAYSQKVFDFAEKSVEIAEKLYKDARIRITEGKISKLNLKKSKAELSVRISRMVDAQQKLREVQNSLTLLISGNHFVSSDSIIAVSELDISDMEYEIPDIGIDSILLTQPEYLLKKNKVEQQSLKLKSYKNDMLPEVNLKGTYGIEADANSEIAAVNKFRDPGFRDKVLSGGIEVDIPILSGIKQRNLLKAQQKILKSYKKEMNTASQKIEKQNELLKERLGKLRIRIKENREEVDFRKKALSSEIDRLNVGKSNYTRIYEIEEDLREAQKKLLRSIMQFKIAEIEIVRINGMMLTRFGLEEYHKGEILLSEEFNDLMQQSFKEAGD